MSSFDAERDFGTSGATDGGPVGGEREFRASEDERDFGTSGTTDGGTRVRET